MSYKLAGVIWNDDGTMATKKLTLQELELLNTASAYNGEQHKAICGKAALELIEYKKIEEELGIDLLTLFKAYHIGFYIKYEDSLTGFIRGGEYYLEVGFETKCFKVKEFEPNGTRWYFKDYGKTWALTKEELL